MNERLRVPRDVRAFAQLEPFFDRGLLAALVLFTAQVLRLVMR